MLPKIAPRINLEHDPRGATRARDASFSTNPLWKLPGSFCTLLQQQGHLQAEFTVCIALQSPSPPPQHREVAIFQKAYREELPSYKIPKSCFNISVEQLTKGGKKDTKCWAPCADKMSYNCCEKLLCACQASAITLQQGKKLKWITHKKKSKEIKWITHYKQEAYFLEQHFFNCHYTRCKEILCLNLAFKILYCSAYIQEITRFQAQKAHQCLHAWRSWLKDQ